MLRFPLLISLCFISLKSRDLPFIDKALENTLTYVNATGKWELRARSWNSADGTAGKLLREYVPTDLRQTIVYRARCFASEVRDPSTECVYECVYECVERVSVCARV